MSNYNPILPVYKPDNRKQTEKHSTNKRRKYALRARLKIFLICMFLLIAGSFAPHQFESVDQFNPHQSAQRSLLCPLGRWCTWLCGYITSGGRNPAEDERLRQQDRDREAVRLIQAQKRERKQRQAKPICTHVHSSSQSVHDDEAEGEIVDILWIPDEAGQKVSIRNAQILEVSGESVTMMMDGASYKCGDALLYEGKILPYIKHHEYEGAGIIHLIDFQKDAKHSDAKQNAYEPVITISAISEDISITIVILPMSDEHHDWMASMSNCPSMKKWFDTWGGRGKPRLALPLNGTDRARQTLGEADLKWKQHLFDQDQTPSGKHISFPWPVESTLSAAESSTYASIEQQNKAQIAKEPGKSSLHPAHAVA